MHDIVSKRKCMLSFDGCDIFAEGSKERVLKTQLTADLGLKTEDSSPQLPPTPFAPFLHFEGCEPLDLEPSSPVNFTQKRANFNRDSTGSQFGRVSLEKEDIMSLAQTNYSSTAGYETKDEDSDEEGVPFIPLVNPSIKVWVMNVATQNTTDTQMPTKKDQPRKGTTILGLLKSKRVNRSQCTRI